MRSLKTKSDEPPVQRGPRLFSKVSLDSLQLDGWDEWRMNSFVCDWRHGHMKNVGWFIKSCFRQTSLQCKFGEDLVTRAKYEENKACWLRERMWFQSWTVSFNSLTSQTTQLGMSWYEHQHDFVFQLIFVTVRLSRRDHSQVNDYFVWIKKKKKNTHTIHFLKGHSTGKVALFEVTLGKRQGTTWTHEPRLVRRISTYAISKSSGTAKEKHEHHDTAATPVVTFIILRWYSSASSNQASWDKI